MTRTSLWKYATIRSDYWLDNAILYNSQRKVKGRQA